MTGTSTNLLLRAHAKVNLNLHVVGVRPDGYHLLRTVFQALALHDDLTFELRDGPFGLCADDPSVPADRRNLIWKAAEAVWGATGRRGEPAGVNVRLTKRIPAQGGLGGGSSDAATALVAFDALWQAGLPPARLSDLARTLGADVPFFLCGGTALGLGRGDVIEPMPDASPLDVVLVFPPFGVSTPEAFRWFDADAAAAVSHAPGRTDTSDSHSPSGAVLRIVNELQGPVGRRHPEIVAACDALADAGAEDAAMTGSGSTVFGLFPPGEGEAAARRLASSGWRTLATTTTTRDVSRPCLEPMGRTRID